MIDPEIEKALKSAPPGLVNIQFDERGYFCAFRKGKIIKEQATRFATAQEAVAALKGK